MKSTYDPSSGFGKNNANSYNKFSQFSPAAQVIGEKSTKEAKKGAKNYALYIRENGGILKGIAVIAALCLMAVSVLGFVWVVNVVNPVWYLVNAINILFAGVILLVEGPGSWTWCGLRATLFKNFGLLTTPLGRAAFYFYLGLTIFSLVTKGDNPLLITLYLAMGGAFTTVGLLQFLMHCNFLCFKVDEEVDDEEHGEAPAI